MLSQVASLPMQSTAGPTQITKFVILFTHPYRNHSTYLTAHVSVDYHPSFRIPRSMKPISENFKF